jgi:predicted transcriptional regulator
MTSRAQELLREAAQELQQADGQQRKADDHKWAAAERMWKASREEGATQTEIADALGISQTTVQRHLSIVEQYSVLNNRPSFTEAFYEVIGDSNESRTRRAAKQFLTEASGEEIEQLGTELPDERLAAVTAAFESVHPATVTRPPIGIGERIREHEQNLGFYMMMQGPLGKLADAAESVRRTWDEYNEDSTDEDRELAQEAIRDSVASLLALISDPQELLA